MQRLYLLFADYYVYFHPNSFSNYHRPFCWFWLLHGLDFTDGNALFRRQSVLFRAIDRLDNCCIVCCPLASGAYLPGTDFGLDNTHVSFVRSTGIESRGRVTCRLGLQGWTAGPRYSHKLPARGVGECCRIGFAYGPACRCDMRNWPDMCPLQTSSDAAHIAQKSLRRPFKNPFGDTNPIVLLCQAVRDASLLSRGAVSLRLVQSAAKGAGAF